MVDEGSGLVFKKRKKQDHDALSIAQSHYISPETPTRLRPSDHRLYNLYENSTHNSWNQSVHYLDSPEPEDEDRSITSTIKLSDTPPANTDPHKYYNYISTSLPDVTRMRQLLLWLGKLEIDRQRPQPTADKELSMARVHAHRLKLKFLQKLANNEINISWITRPNIHDLAKKKPNPVNEKRAEKLKKLKAVLADLKAEEKEWHDEINNTYSLHASMMDERNRHNTDDDPDHYIQYLPAEEQAIYHNVPSTTNAFDYTVKDFDMDISRLLQMGNAIDKYQEKSGKYADMLLQQVMTKMKERTRIVPIETTIPYPTEDIDAIQKKEENENILDILRLLSRKATV